MFSFYNIITPQESFFYGGNETLVETETPLNEYRTKKQKLINDTSAVMVDFLAKSEELQEGKNKLYKSNEYDMRQRGYLFYTRSNISLLNIHRYSEMGDRIHNHYLLIKYIREKKHKLVDMLTSLSRYMGHKYSFTKSKANEDQDNIYYYEQDTKIGHKYKITTVSSFRNGEEVSKLFNDLKNYDDPLDQKTAKHAKDVNNDQQQKNK